MFPVTYTVAVVQMRHITSESISFSYATVEARIVPMTGEESGLQPELMKIGVVLELKHKRLDL
jgi:hypothetical protein